MFSSCVFILLLATSVAGQFNFGNILGGLGGLLGGGSTTAAAAATAAASSSAGLFGGGGIFGGLFGGANNVLGNLGNTISSVTNGVNQVTGGINTIQNIIKNPTMNMTGIGALNGVLGNLGMLGGAINGITGGLGTAFGGLGGLFGGAATTAAGATTAAASPAAAPATAAAAAGGLFGNLLGAGGLFGGLFGGAGATTAAGATAAASGGLLGGLFGGSSGGIFGGGIFGGSTPSSTTAAAGTATSGQLFGGLLFGGALFGASAPVTAAGATTAAGAQPAATAAAPAPAGAGGEEDGNDRKAQVGVGVACRGVGGTCQDSESFNCPLAFVRGVCPGNDNVRCCPDAAAGSGVTQNQNVVVPALSVDVGSRGCALVRATGCSALGGRRMTINKDFGDEIIRVNAHARNAGINLYIIDSFRPAKVTYGAARSLHRAGMAIDMNANGCNAACLCAGKESRNTGAANFLTAVMGDSNLRWGGDPTKKIPWPVSGCPYDSVHIEATDYDPNTYDTIVPCLNAEYDAKRFESFTCDSGAALLNDDVVALEKLSAAGTAEPLGAGAIAAIAIFGVLALAGCIGVGVCLVMRHKNNKAADVDVTNSAYGQAEANADTMMSARQHSGTVGGGGAGAFACQKCGKQYNYEADLAEHVALRHA